MMHDNEYPHARILIVDDQEANLRLLSLLLKKAHYTHVTVTSNPGEVIDLVREAQPDLLLLDLMMPGPDGFEVMSQLGSIVGDSEYLPILVLTADATPESKLRALREGATDFLTKPFDPTEVLLRVRNLLHTRFLHLELLKQNQVLEEKVLKRTDALARMLHQAMDAQEVERRRLSMEIHDGPLQSLGVCTLMADRVLRRYARGEHDLAVEGIRELRDGLSNTINDIRGVLADLSLEIWESYGLVSALRDYISRFSKSTDIIVEAHIDEDAGSRLSPQAGLLIYRLAQEALSNVRKHALARKAELRLQIVGPDLYMSVTDYGRGFDVNAALQVRKSGEQLGLRSMRDRIESAGGEMSIRSVPGDGTSLQFRYPLGPEAHEKNPSGRIHARE